MSKAFDKVMKTADEEATSGAGYSAEEIEFLTSVAELYVGTAPEVYDGLAELVSSWLKEFHLFVAQNDIPALCQRALDEIQVGVTPAWLDENVIYEMDEDVVENFQSNLTSVKYTFSL